MSAQIYRMIAKTDLFTFTIGAPAVGTTGTNFPYTLTASLNNAIFSFSGSALSLSFFRAESNIIVSSCYFSIPNLPGIEIVNQGGRKNFLPIQAVASGGAQSSPFSLPAYGLEREIDVSTVFSTPTATENFQLHISGNSLNWMYLDTRNTLAAYDGISVFLQAEINVSSPYALGIA